MIKTANFNPSVDVKLCCTCGDPRCDKRSVNQYSLDQLQKIRDDFGRPIIVTSGGRCPHHPDEKSRTKPADHQKCYAVDVRCINGDDETKIKVLAGRHGATRVAGGVYTGFIHIAWTPTERKDVPTWRY